MKKAYKKLNKHGRFLFWWFTSSTFLFILIITGFLLLFSSLKNYQKKIVSQQSTISKLKRENDSQTAAILRLVTQLEKNGG